MDTVLASVVKYFVTTQSLSHNKLLEPHSQNSLPVKSRKLITRAIQTLRVFYYQIPIKQQRQRSLLFATEHNECLSITK